MSARKDPGKWNSTGGAGDPAVVMCPGVPDSGEGQVSGGRFVPCDLTPSLGERGPKLGSASGG